MDEGLARKLRHVLQAQRVAALGTLHKGEPYVSMVPFAILPDGSAFVVHVSGLAAHTRDMRACPQVSLLVIAPSSDEVPPQATPRVTIQGNAMPCAPSSSAHEEARRAYLSRFPESSMTFELPDFSLFAIRPSSIRFVGGFAQAKTLTPGGLARVLADDGA